MLNRIYKTKWVNELGRDIELNMNIHMKNQKEKKNEKNQDESEEIE